MIMKQLQPYAYTTCLALTMLLTDCSSHIPAAIQLPLKNALSIQQAQQNSIDHIDLKARWGGTILQTENKQNASWISIVAFQLDSTGRPMESGDSTGRFIAIFDEFLEPLVYTGDRQITISGTLIRTEPRKVGEFAYNYPVIKVDHYYLWPRISTLDTDYSPYWRYDPWYDPWYYPVRPYYPRHKPQEK